jgi:hypothetical protein
MYFIIDANIAAGYYLPQSMTSEKARYRIKCIIDYIRLNIDKHFIYIPNICIAETFSVFYKYAFGAWNPHVIKNGKITRTQFLDIVDKFQTDIHNGKFMYHYEVNRYHILGINYIAPIDHYFQYSRKTNAKKRITPMGTFDHIIISMAMHLSHIHGNKNTCLITTDSRMSNMLNKCKSKISRKTQERIGLDIAENVCGRPFSMNLFPEHLNLKDCTNDDLVKIFGKWPL